MEEEDNEDSFGINVSRTLLWSDFSQGLKAASLTLPQVRMLEDAALLMDKLVVDYDDGRSVGIPYSI